MSKNARRALMGFAQGAIQGAIGVVQTRQLQEAERLKEERLAAIRAEDRAFQRETLQLQERSLERRDARQAEQMAERDERLALQQADRDAVLAKQQMERDARLAAEQRKNLELAAANRDPANVGYVEMLDPQGRPIVMRRDDPRLAGDLSGYRFRGDTTTAAPAPAAPAAPASAAATRAGAPATEPKTSSLGTWDPVQKRWIP